MVNRWQGNTGKHIRIDELPSQPERYQQPRKAPPSQAPRDTRPRRTPLFPGGLSGLLPTEPGELDTEDLILLLILYLMYRESGDSELLIIMGAMFLL